ncbi:uncharacterized protein DUF1772 [Kribbella antiqua]|uniref:Uncharacterized protein DUF1772 n=1 Tax=Kribbella antiqua TaxID=2512217 RepID=A0A4R2J8A5_9ACTN|nr:anthrone oxygenase family protein [Kribbella antiqua]TCO51285.1 uncharacterized protein DUF1772 [Kribbella antiqua]
MRITRVVGLVGCAILTGVAATVLVLELALRSLDGPAYVGVRQAEFWYFNWFIGLVFVPTIVAVAVLVVQARRAQSTERRAVVIALVLLLVASVVTVVVNGPINLEELGWNVQAPPADWARVRDRWLIAHAVRTVAIAVALGYLSVATLGRRTTSK